MSDPWTQEQQISFEIALLTYTSYLDREERWTKIAASIQGNNKKSRNQCIARYRYLKEFVLSKLKVEAAARQDM